MNKNVPFYSVAATIIINIFGVKKVLKYTLLTNFTISTHEYVSTKMSVGKFESEKHFSADNKHIVNWRII